jgi:cysteine desulfurase
MRIGKTIYLDHQASTPVDSRVFAAMAPYADRAFANPHSSDHALGWESAEATEQSAIDIGRLIGADPDEIIFTSGATEANNLALLGLNRGCHAPLRDTVLAAATDHKSILAPGRALEKSGSKFQCVRVDATGRIDLDHLEICLSDAVLLVSINLVNSEIGTIQDLGAIANITRRNGALLHCDASQAPCTLDIATLADFADLISLSGHKVYGPKGIGVLYIRRSIQPQIEPMIFGGGQQRNLRSGTVPTPLCVGFAAALRIATDESAVAERERLASLRDSLIRQIRNGGWQIILNGPPAAHRHSGNANLQFVGFSAHDLLGMLQPSLAASVGSACSTGIPEPSHVLRALGLDEREAGASVRFSIGRYTTQVDVDAAASLICEALGKMSRAGLRDAG